MKLKSIKKICLVISVIFVFCMSSTPLIAKAYNVGGDGTVKLTSWNMDNYGNRNDLWTQVRDKYDPIKIKGKMVAGDFDGNGIDEIAAFYDYGVEQTEIHLFKVNQNGYTTTSVPWSSKTFDSNCIIDKVVVGDFDGDKKDEILTMYGYANGEMALFLFKANADGTAFQAQRVYESKSFLGSNVVDIVSGDFDGDGIDEVSAIYNYGGYHMAIFEYKQESESRFSGRLAYESFECDANRIKNKVVAGDYLGDTKDEIVMFYDYGNTKTEAWVFTNINGKYSTESLWSSDRFNGNSITDKVTTTRYKGSKKDKIVSLYDYGNNTTGIITWVQDGGRLKSTKEIEYSNYEAERTNGRVVAGNFTGQAMSLVTMYDGSIVKAPEISSQQKVVNEAMRHLGKAYVYGATGPDTFDCSGFTQYVYRQALGIDITRTTYTQVNQGVEVSRSNLKPGDLIFPHAGHVQLYIGNGQVIHAPHTGDVVRIAPLGDVWHARRIIN